ncbi:MAG: tRNA pseudouridine(55) synthase TruB [Spirochaetales bacterium]|nr:MAG: tRNA pseudouridine(55) synthase TruB [Spirochaetales bacterium]
MSESERFSVPRSGLVLYDKPEGVTSFSALSGIKKALETGKIGHTGTLDKFASGLLCVLTGRMTRLNRIFTGLDKEYEAVFQFGRETDTLDPEGAVIAECSPPAPETLRAVIPRFLGEINQVPPVYSAVHVDGARASKLARQGKTVNLEARKITIHALDLLRAEGSEVAFRISCSKGTYIRSLARDMGRAAGSCAYVSSLKRTRVGDFSLSESVRMDDFDPARHLLQVKDWAGRLPATFEARIKPEYRSLILHGHPLEVRFFSDVPSKDGFYALFDENGGFLAFAEKAGNIFRYLVTGEGE